MRLYRINDTAAPAGFPFTPIFRGTRQEAQSYLKSTWDDPALRQDIEVAEIDVKTDKEGILAALAGTPKYEVLKAWRGTGRGSLAPSPWNVDDHPKDEVQP